MLDGVVICGGEPTIHKKLPAFIKRIKDMGFLVKLDTNGSNPKMLRDLISKKLVDYVAMDIKASIGGKTQNSKLKVQSDSLKFKIKIKKSAELLKKGRVDFEFRTTVVPTVHKKEDFLKIAKWIGGKNVKYYLQNFRPQKTLNPEFEKIKPYPNSYLLGIKKQISKYFKVCKIR